MTETHILQNRKAVVVRRTLQGNGNARTLQYECRLLGQTCLVFSLIKFLKCRRDGYAKRFTDGNISLVFSRHLGYFSSCQQLTARII